MLSLRVERENNNPGISKLAADLLLDDFLILLLPAL
jgi:hypothetical protein